MASTFDEALRVARDRYPHTINFFEEYENYFVFGYDDGNEYVGGTTSPIVIRKSDLVALNYAPIFFNMDVDAEDVGDVISKGVVS